MSKLSELVEKTRKKIDEAIMVNASTFGDTIENCLPYSELEDCETLEELSIWLQDFIFSLQDVSEKITNFAEELNKIDNECD